MPTSQSVQEIESRINLRLPDLLIQMAMRCDSFSSVFLSIGPDIENHSHIIPYNRYWRRRRRTRKLPSDLVIITNGWMDEDFWCFVRSPQGTGIVEPRLQYWSPAPVGYPKDGVRGEMHANIEEFVERLIQEHAARVDA